jgi:GNAT superfamily N-acetyltransferase
MSFFDPRARLDLARQRQEELLHGASSGSRAFPLAWPPRFMRRRAPDSSDLRSQGALIELRRGSYVLTTDPSRLDLEEIHRYLAEESYWARDLNRDLLERAVRNSLCIGLYDGRRQVGFGRAITDYATFGYLADVFIREGHRGSGLGTWLVHTLLSHPSISGSQRWMLRTKDAHGFYARLGFRPARLDRRLMIREDEDGAASFAGGSQPSAIA